MRSRSRLFTWGWVLVLVGLAAGGCRLVGTPVPTATVAPVATAIPTPIPTPIPTLAPTATAVPTEPQPLPTGTAPPTPLSPSPGADGVGDPYFPQMGNGGYDVQHYTLDLSVDMERNVLDGTTTVEAQATQDLGRFNLDFRGLTISEVLVNGQPASYERDEGELMITPNRPLGEGDAFAVAISYSGTPGEDLLEGVPPYGVGWNYYGHGVSVAGEPAGAARWYPVNEHPLDKATYTFRITVAEPYVVAANGLLQDTIDNGDTLTYVWEMGDPMASYLVTVAIGDFVVETDVTSGGVPIRNYFAASLPQEVGDAFDRTPEMIDYFETVFGPYPFQVYGVVAHDVALPFAIETQTLSVFGSGPASEILVSHELAHQWFGDSVTPAAWRHVWLNEGFATYASALWTEYAHGADAADGMIRYLYEYAVSNESGSVLVGEPPPDDLFNRMVYNRGALTLHALRLRIGDDPFFETLRAYTGRFHDGNASIEDFVAVAERVSGQDLGDLFQAWLFERPVPDMPEMGLYREDFLP